MAEDAALDAIQPDWRRLADGRLHRLRAGRDYRGDVRAQIRDARAVADELGRHVITTRDDLGNAAYLWVQFVDGMLATGDPCPRCGEASFVQLGQRIVRCRACGAALELRPPAPGETLQGVIQGRADDADEEAQRADRMRAVRRLAATQTALVDPRELLRDGDFADVVGRVTAARATRLDLARLWALWEAAGLGADAGGDGAALGSAWASGGAFLATALTVRAGERRHCAVVDLPRYQQHASLLEPGQLEDAIELIEAVGGDVVAGDLPAVRGKLSGRCYGVVHLDLAEEAEVTAALEFFDARLQPYGAIVVEDYRIPVGTEDRSVLVARGVAVFLDRVPGRYAEWRTPTRQQLLIRIGA